MTGRNLRPDDNARLAARCEAFMTGTKKLYDKSNGDMWFFELYHHLEACRAALAAEHEAAPRRQPFNPAEK